MAVRFLEDRQLRIVHKLDALVAGFTAHCDALSELSSLLPYDNSPQGQPLFPSKCPCLDMGMYASCSISIDVASYRLRLGLGNCIVSGGQAQHIEITKVPEHRSHRTASFLRDFERGRHCGLAAKQAQEGLDECLPSALGA